MSWPGDSIPWTPVSSSNVEAVSWRLPPGRPGVLLVRFLAKAGRPSVIYEYRRLSPHGATRKDAEAMLAAPSHGRWLDRVVKKNVGAWDVQGPFRA